VERERPGLSFAAKTVLKASIVVLGTGHSFLEVLTIGGSSWPSWARWPWRCPKCADGWWCLRLSDTDQVTGRKVQPEVRIEGADSGA